MKTDRSAVVRCTLAIAALVAAMISLPSSASAATNTCIEHDNIDGFNFGTCLNALGTNWEVRPEIYVNKVNTNVLSGCWIEIELWGDHGEGKLPGGQDAHVFICNPTQQQNPLVGITFHKSGCGAVSAHADAYLHAANGGFRIGPSRSLTVQPYPGTC